MYSVFRLITSVWTYLILVGVFVLIRVLTHTGDSVWSMRWMPSLNVSQNQSLGSADEIKRQAVGSLAVQLAYSNIALGSTQGSSSVTSLPQGNTIEQSLELTRMFVEFREHMLSLLESSIESQIFNEQVKRGSVLVNAASTLISQLDTHIKDYRGQVELCSAQKRQADDLYNISLKSYDSANVQRASAQAQEANTCIGHNSTLANSYQGIRTELVRELDRSSRFLTLLENNKQLIISYGGLLSSDTPDQLRRLQQDLRKL